METTSLNTNEILPYYVLLERLTSYVKAVPVAHSVKVSNGEERLVLNGKDFFLEDYSYVFANSQYTGQELISLWDALKFNTSIKSDIGSLFEWQRSYEVQADYYRKTVHVALNSLEAFCRDIAAMIAGPENEGGRWVFNSFFMCPFRNIKHPSDKDYIIPVEDIRLKNFFLTVKRFRNDSTHHNVTAFSAPITADNLISYCRNIHLSIVMFVLVIIERFYTELIAVAGNELITKKNKLDEETVSSIGKIVINSGYIKRAKDEIRKRLHESFRGTMLYNNSDVIWNELAELKIRKHGDEKKYICREIVTQNINRILLTGDPGSGKSVLLFQMILQDKPHMLPLYITADEIDTDLPPDEIVSRKVLGAENLLLTPVNKACGLKRLSRLLKEGETIFFIDAVETRKDGLEKIVKFIDTYPECHVVAASQPDDSGLIEKTFVRNGFVHYEICPFERQQALKLMKTYSLLMHNIDHSKILDQKIRLATDGLPIMMHPLSLLLLIHIFESSPKLNVHSINRTRLYYMMIKSIEDNKLLNEDERGIILNQAFIRQYQYDVDEVKSLGIRIIPLLKEKNQAGWTDEILKCTFLQSDNGLRTLFEILELLPEVESRFSNEITILRTLIATVILNQSSSEKDPVEILLTDGRISISGNNLPEPSANLVKLASALKTVEYRPVATAECDSRNEDILYRLRPKYIVESYIANMLLIYSGSEVHYDDERLVFIFKAAAILSTPRLMKMLFNFRWLKEWLVNCADESHVPGLKGYAVKDNNLVRTLINYTTDYPAMLQELILQYDDMVGLSLLKTTNDISAYIYEIITTKMNDEQLEKFILTIVPSLEGSLDQHKLAYWKNLAIVSMESLTLVDNYDTSVSKIPDGKILERLFTMNNKRDAFRILALWLRTFKSNGRYIYRFDAIMEHLIRFKAYNLDKVKEIFWENISVNLNNELLRNKVLAFLDMISIEDIPEDIAGGLYDLRLIEYQKILAATTKECRTQWHENLPIWSNRQLFRMVSVGTSFHNRVSCSLYSQPSATTYIVATESIDEMPEGKFCRIEGFDQWFSVQDVQDLKVEHPMSHIAYIMLTIEDWMPRNNTGFVVIFKDKKEMMIPYVHLYDRGGTTVVLRVEDPVSVSILKNKNVVRNIRQDQSCQFNGEQAWITGVEVLPVNPLTRLVWLHPIRNDGSEYSKRHMAINDFPEEGKMSFFHSKKIDKNVSKCKPLSLKMLSDETFAKNNKISNCLYLSAENNFMYLALPIFLQANQWLMPASGKWAAQVVSSVDIRTQEHDNEDISKKLKGHMWKLRKSGSFSDYLYISQIKFFGEKPDFKEDAEKKINAVVAYYEPMSRYFPREEKKKDVPNIAVSYIRGNYRYIGGEAYIELPYTVYPQNATYYCCNIMPKRMPVVWEKPVGGEAGKIYIAIDRSMMQLWREKEQNDIEFYNDMNSPHPLSIEFDSLLSLVDLNTPEVYHGSIVDMLMEEWKRNRKVGIQEFQFCEAKMCEDKFTKQFGKLWNGRNSY